MTWYELIKAFKDETGEGIILNTSFNLAGEPLVDTSRCNQKLRTRRIQSNILARMANTKIIFTTQTRDNEKR